jgi:single-strand DNA-binding protein
MNLNKAMIIGNLTREPETRTTPNGQNVTTFGVATNLIWTDSSGNRQKKAEYHNIVAWRKLGEICAQYLHKGSKVYIEGRIQTREWEGQDGVKRYRTEIIAENMIMLDAKNLGGAAGPSTSDDFSQPTPAAGEQEIQIEDIPF